MSTVRTRMVPVIESGQALRLFFELEREVVRTLSAFVPRVGDLELKYKLAEHVWEAAQHARFLRERGRELSGFGSDERVRDDVRRIFEESLHEEDELAGLAAYVRVLSTGLRRAYTAYLEAAQPLADWPTRNLVREFVDDLDRHELELESWLDRERPAWTAHLDAAYRARGGWYGEVAAEPLPAGFAWRQDERDYAHPALPNRGAHPICATAFGEDPDEFPIVRSWLSDPATDARVVRAMVYVWLLGEADAVDYLATIFYDTPSAPFDYHFDLARHTWDESRHSNFGYRQLPRLGFDLMEVEQQVVLYDVLVRMQPHERYVMVTAVFEAGSFDIKAEVMNRVGELGDFEADTLLAFDRSDEQNHVRYGHRWLPTLLELHGDDRDPKTFAAETEARFWELNAAARDRIGHGLPQERRLTARRIRERVAAENGS
ncbi:MAG TPA: DUF455 family protein [Gaiellaceae bacterium]|nr:DUF455 family protein [Gaiellaceae bacterium]